MRLKRQLQVVSEPTCVWQWFIKPLIINHTNGIKRTRKKNSMMIVVSEPEINHNTLQQTCLTGKKGAT